MKELFIKRKVNKICSFLFKEILHVDIVFLKRTSLDFQNQLQQPA